MIEGGMLILVCSLLSLDNKDLSQHQQTYQNHNSNQKQQSRNRRKNNNRKIDSSNVLDYNQDPIDEDLDEFVDHNNNNLDFSEGQAIDNQVISA